MGRKSGEQVFGNWSYNPEFGWSNLATGDHLSQPHGISVSDYGHYLQQASPSPEPTPIPGNSNWQGTPSPNDYMQAVLASLGNQAPSFREGQPPNSFLTGQFPDYDYEGTRPWVEAMNNWPQFQQGQPANDFLTGNFPDYGNLTPWASSSNGWPQSGSPSVGGNIMGGDYGIGNNVPSFNDYGWNPPNYGNSQSGPASQGGYDIGGFAGLQPGFNNISGFSQIGSLGQAPQSFNDYGWTPVSYGNQGGASQGGSIFGGDNFSLGNNVPSFNDYGWAPANYGSQGSPSVGGNMELGGYGSPHWSGDLLDPNIYGGTYGDNAIGNFGGLNDPSSFDISGGHPLGYTASGGLNYYTMPDGSRQVYDSDWNWLGSQQQSGGQSNGNSQPTWNLGNLPLQNLSLQPPSGIGSNPFGYGSSGSGQYLNAAGQTVNIQSGGGGYGYSPTSVYGPNGQYMGANFTGSFAGQATGIGGIMGQGNSWNHETQSSGTAYGGGGLGGDAVVTGSHAGEGLSGEANKWGWTPHGSGTAPGHMGHLAAKVK